jgi:hypothetical protein
MSSLNRCGSILHGVSNALAQVLAADSQTVTAELCGCSQPSVCRRGDDLHQWPASDIMRLAIHRPALAESIRRALNAIPDRGDATLTIPELIREIEEQNANTFEIAKAISDGVVSKREAFLVREKLQKMVQNLNDHVFPCLAAIEGSESLP